MTGSLKLCKTTRRLPANTMRKTLRQPDNLLEDLLITLPEHNTSKLPTSKSECSVAESDSDSDIEVIVSPEMDMTGPKAPGVGPSGARQKEKLPPPKPKSNWMEDPGMTSPEDNTSKQESCTLVTPFAESDSDSDTEMNFILQREDIDMTRPKPCHAGASGARQMVVGKEMASCPQPKLARMEEPDMTQTEEDNASKLEMKRFEYLFAESDSDSDIEVIVSSEINMTRPKPPRDGPSGAQQMGVIKEMDPPKPASLWSEDPDIRPPDEANTSKLESICASVALLSDPKTAMTRLVESSRAGPSGAQETGIVNETDPCPQPTLTRMEDSEGENSSKLASRTSVTLWKESDSEGGPSGAGQTGVVKEKLPGLTRMEDRIIATPEENTGELESSTSVISLVETEFDSDTEINMMGLKSTRGDQVGVTREMLVRSFVCHLPLPAIKGCAIYGSRSQFTEEMDPQKPASLWSEDPEEDKTSELESSVSVISLTESDSDSDTEMNVFHLRGQINMTIPELVRVGLTGAQQMGVVSST